MTASHGPGLINNTTIDMRSLAFLLLTSIFLLSANADAVSVEMWATLLDDSVPTTTPSGRIEYNTSVVLRFDGSGGHQCVNLWGTVSFVLYRASGEKIEGGPGGQNHIVQPGEKDLYPLSDSKVGARCFPLFLNGDTLSIADGTGRFWSFRGVRKERLRLEVIFDGRDDWDETRKRFEKRIEMGVQNYFFKGRIVCKAVEFTITELPKDNPYEEFVPPL